VNRYPRILISAVNSGSGKTTIALGLMLALGRQGLKVQPFKVGPDYIDPTYHTLVTGNISRNLDSWLCSKGAVLELFLRAAQDADISLIEGVMGLYDGLRDTEEGSSAQAAKILSGPVILIMDAGSMSRSAAAIALGYKMFDRKVNIAGIILNKTGSPSHYSYLKMAIERETKVPVLGFLPKTPGLILAERHLGLVAAQENGIAKEFSQQLLKLMEANIDIKRIIRISRSATALSYPHKKIFSVKSAHPAVKIAIARDKAFYFYYQDNLDILKRLGAELLEFSPLKDTRLPTEINGIYIGGGFPELYASSLAKNVKLKEAIRQQAKQGLPIYAECGGLMYLVKNLVDFKKKSFPMTGIFDCSVNMADKLQSLGYVEIDVLRDNILSKKGDKNRAHAFHWSYLDGLPKGTEFAYRLKKNNKIFDDGLIYQNVLAGYTHLHFASNIDFAGNFVKSCQERG